MSQKVLQYVVIFLAILIIICFFALVYGFYIKIAEKQTNLDMKNIYYNLELEDGHEITDIDLINKDKILFTIKNNDKIYAILYDIVNENITKIDNKND